MIKFLHLIFIITGAADYFGPASRSAKADSDELDKAACELKVDPGNASSCFDSTFEPSNDPAFRRGNKNNDAIFVTSDNEKYSLTI